MLRLATVLVALLPLVASAATTLKISTLYPDGTTIVTGLKNAGKEIADKTEGRVKLKIYPGGVMGDDRAVERKIRIGQLHGMIAQGGAFASAYKDSQILNVPLAFNNYDEVDAVRAELDPVIEQGLEQGGWVSFGLVDGGFAYVMSENPVKSLDDLRDQKLWLPANDEASAKASKAFELSPIMLNIGAVLTSLQTGAINAFAAPPVVLAGELRDRYAVTVHLRFVGHSRKILQAHQPGRPESRARCVGCNLRYAGYGKPQGKPECVPGGAATGPGSDPAQRSPAQRMERLRRSCHCRVGRRGRD